MDPVVLDKINDRKYPNETNLEDLTFSCGMYSVVSLGLVYRVNRLIRVQKSAFLPGVVSLGFLILLMTKTDKLADLIQHRTKYPELYQDSA